MAFPVLSARSHSECYFRNEERERRIMAFSLQTSRLEEEGSYFSWRSRDSSSVAIFSQVWACLVGSNFFCESVFITDRSHCQYSLAFSSIFWYRVLPCSQGWPQTQRPFFVVVTDSVLICYVTEASLQPQIGDSYFIVNCVVPYKQMVSWIVEYSSCEKDLFYLLWWIVGEILSGVCGVSTKLVLGSVALSQHRRQKTIHTERMKVVCSRGEVCHLETGRPGGRNRAKERWVWVETREGWRANSRGRRSVVGW